MKNQNENALRYIEHRRIEFLSLDNLVHMNFIKNSLDGVGKVVLDTNIYSPLLYDWILNVNNNVELITRILDKGCDYEQRLLELLTQDNRIFATKSIVEEISMAPPAWKSRWHHDTEYGYLANALRYDKNLSKSIIKNLTIKVREYVASIIPLYNFLVEDKRVFNEDYNNMKQHYFSAVFCNSKREYVSIYNDRKIVKFNQTNKL